MNAVVAWHSTVRRAVAALPCAGERAEASRTRILDDLQRLPRPFDQHAGATHVTASAVVCGPRGVLLHRHKRLGLWLQPGGHLDDGEPPWDAALRETAEETGLERLEHPGGAPRLLHVDVHHAALGHEHLDLRYLVHADGEPAPPAGESQQVRWFGFDEALALVDDSLRAALLCVADRG